MDDQQQPTADTAPVPDAARPLPFTLRVAVTWTAIAEMPHREDGQLFYRRRTPLTGELALTGAGRDVAFTDIEVP